VTNADTKCSLDDRSPFNHSGSWAVEGVMRGDDPAKVDFLAFGAIARASFCARSGLRTIQPVNKAENAFWPMMTGL